LCTRASEFGNQRRYKFEMGRVVEPSRRIVVGDFVRGRVVAKMTETMVGGLLKIFAKQGPRFLCRNNRQTYRII